MKRDKAPIIIKALCLAILAASLLPTGTVADDDLPFNMRLNAGEQVAGGTSMMQISISKWTSPEERQMLIDYLQEGGSRSVNDRVKRSTSVLQSLSVKGRINRVGQLGTNWRYAYRFPKDGGSTIVLAGDRPVNVNETMGRGVVRQTDNIALAVIELDDEGQGAGTLMLGSELILNADGRLKVNNLGQNGVHLGGVQVLN